MKKSLILILLAGLSLSAWAIVPPRHLSDTASYNRKVRMMYQVSDLSKAPMREQAVGIRKIFHRVPVILVNYPDMRYRVSRADVDSMFNGANYTKDGATGSVRQYFYDQSYEEYNPQFDIYGPVTVSQNYAYYANLAEELVLEACALMDDSLDFTWYNLNGDNKVDLVYCLYAGPPASDGGCISSSWISNPDNLIWPHYWTITNAGSHGKTSVFDGVTIDDYEVSSELDGCYSSADQAVLAGVGLACHEFGHGLGLPDLYPTGQSPHNGKTSGDWDIMDQGCYNNDVHTPPCYSAYERWLMGWLDPTLLHSASTDTLPAIGSSPKAFYMTESGNAVSDILSPTPNVFYLMENRQNTGWDAYLPGHGMLITKITYNATRWQYNTINGTKNNLGIDILEADGLTPSTSEPGGLGKPGDTYPTGSTSFTSVANYQLTEITETDGLIIFKVNGGATPTGIEETESTNAPRKILRDGRVVILRGEKEFDILGKEL